MGPSNASAHADKLCRSDVRSRSDNDSIIFRSTSATAPQAPPGAVVFTTSPIPFAVRNPAPGTDLDSGTPGLGVALWLACDDAEALQESLAAAGVPIITAPFDGPFGKTLTDMSELKALTHPIRLRLLYALRANKSMTATQLGDLVDESPASVSYHLRKLAAHGFVKEVENGSDKRRRWWSEANEDGFSWSENDFADSPESLSVAKASKDSWLAHQWSRLRDFDRTSESWGAEWISAAFSTDNVLRLTASETAELDVELRAVVDKWRRHGEDATSGEREHVMVLMHGFPTTP